MSAQKRVVILGSGFAGLYLAKSLANRDVQVVLVDRNNHHLFQVRPEILVLGDAAAHTHQPGLPLVPAICPAAIQMGEHASRVIGADLAGKARKPFRYRDRGQLAVIGRGYAVAEIGRVQSAGFFAWLLWIFVHIFFLIGFRTRLLVMIEWAWSYFTLQRGARLITGSWRQAGERFP